MKRNLLSKAFTLLALVAVIALSGCVLNIEPIIDVDGDGILKITNYSNDAVVTVIVTTPGSKTSVYENTVDIRSNEYDEIEYPAGTYDIWLYMTYSDAEYYHLEEDVVIIGGLTTAIDVYTGEWLRNSSSRNASEVYASVKK